MLFVIIFVLKTCATNITEWSIGSENDCRVIHCSEIDCLNVIKVVINLKVIGIVSVEGLPFMGNFIKGISGQIGRYVLIGTIWTNHSFNMPDRSCKLL